MANAKNHRKPQFTLKVWKFSKDQCVTREILQTAFSPFGELISIYLHPSKSHAFVSYTTKEYRAYAFENFKVNGFGWQIEEVNPKPKTVQSETNSQKSEDSSSTVDMDFSLEESNDYVDVHGRQLTVYLLDNSELLIPLREIKQTGFALFTKENYDRVLVNSEQINKEFRLFMLSEAKKYFLRNDVIIKESIIVDTIKRCEQMLLDGDNASAPVQQKEERPVNKMTAGRTIVSDNNNIQITTSTSRNNNQQPLHRKSYRSNVNNSNVSSSLAIPSSNTQNNISNNVTSAPKPQRNRESPMMRPPKSFPNQKSNETPVNNGIKKNGNVNEKQPSQEPLKKINKIQLRPGTEYEIKIAFKEKENFYWVNLNDSKNSSIVPDIFNELNGSNAVHLKDTKPIPHKYCVAEYKNAWYRALIRKCEPSAIELSFVDFGNKEIVTSVKELPNHLFDIEMQAIPIIIDLDLDVDQTLKIKCLQENPDGSYDVALLPEEKEEIKEKRFFNNPKPLCNLKNKDKVVIIDYDEQHLYVRTKECVDRLKMLNDHIKTCNIPVYGKVEVGQTVLCPRAESNAMVRGVVKRINKNIYTIKYIDYCNEENFTISSICNVDERIASEPSYLLVTPEFQVLKTLKSEKPNEYLINLINKCEKLTVCLSQDIFDLEIIDPADNSTRMLAVLLSSLDSDNEVSLSEVIPEPPIITQTFTRPTSSILKPVSKSNRIMFSDMKLVDVEIGQLKEYICCTFRSVESVTLVDLSEHSQEILGIEVTSSEAYYPIVNEMCLALFINEEEASWSRGMVIRKIDDDTFEVMFVDFGNVETVKAENLRPLTPKYKQFPIVGIPCAIDLPNKPQINAVLREILDDMAAVNANIKSKMPNGQYLVEIPVATSTLRSKRLL